MRERLSSLGLALVFGSLSGFWLLWEPLLTHGPLLRRCGASATELVIRAAIAGFVVAVLLSVGILIRTIPRKLAFRASLSLSAAVFGGLIVYWAARSGSLPIDLGSQGARLITSGSFGLAVGLLVAWVVHGWERGSRAARTFGWCLLLLTLLPFGALTVGAWSQHSPRQPVSEARAGTPIERVYLITIDALRSDRLSAYGYSHPTTPNLDRLAREGTLYERCYSQGNRTEIAFGSMLTGLLPSSHGVSRERGDARALPLERTTLAEALADNGYTTVGLLTNPHLKHGFGLDQGFQSADEFYYGYRDLLVCSLFERTGLVREPTRTLGRFPRAPEVTDRALEMLHEQRDRPLFALVHYMDVHHPYMPPPEISAAFTTPGAASTDAHVVFDRATRRGQKVEVPGEDPFPQEEILRLSDLYDASIAFVDREIGRLLAGLEETGMLENSLIVITGDHGDEFGEHGYLFHQNPVPIESLTQVPLILWGQGIPSANEIATPVAHVDIVPTLLAMLGIEQLEASHGRPLPLDPSAPIDSERTLTSEGIGWSAIREYEDDRFLKLWWDDRESEGFLFDLDNDPGETKDIASLHPDIVRRMTARLLTLRQGDRRDVVGGKTIDPQVLEELRSLGYIDGGGSPAAP